MCAAEEAGGAEAAAGGGMKLKALRREPASVFAAPAEIRARGYIAAADNEALSRMK